MLELLSKSIVTKFNAIIAVVLTAGLLSFAIVIGYDSYNRTIDDLTSKSEGTISLASISLVEAIWNIDDETISNVMNAILTDTDVVGMRVDDDGKEAMSIKIRGVDSEEVSLDERKEKFIELQKQEIMISKNAPVTKEGNTIGIVHLITSKEKANSIILYTMTLIFGFAISLVVVLFFIVLLVGKKIIKKPISKLQDSATQLAEGDLDAAIDTRRSDELGQLARQFLLMRDSIKKKIGDLHTLNATGERLSSITDKHKALNIVLEVLSQHLNVEWGSIYLFNEATNRLEISTFYPEQEHVENMVKKEAKTFGIGEGIAGKTVEQNKILTVADTSKENDFIKVDDESEAHSLVSIPMMDDNSVFGVMNFSGKVGQISVSKEDEGFAETLSRMTVVSTKNILMLNVIEEQNRTLEHKVEERTAELKIKTRDINNMLSNLAQGIFTILEDKTIHPEYSVYLESIFESDEIGGKNVMELLFGKSNLGVNTLDQIKVSIDSMIGEDVMMFEFNKHLLVSEYDIVLGATTKIIEVDWNPIVNDDAVVEKLMVTVRDVTELRGLEAEAAGQKRELDIIGQILSVSQKKFESFIKTSHEFIDENKQLITETKDKDTEVVARLFRNLHTIKGNARTYGFDYVTDAVHAAEQTYQQIRSHEATWNTDELLAELSEAMHFIEEYEGIFEEKLAKFTEGDADNISVEAQLINKMHDTVNSLKKDNVEHLFKATEKIRDLLKAIETESLEYVLEGIVKGMPSLAKELNKPTPILNINHNEIRLLSSAGETLRNVFMHTFRNSMDHGLESAEDRKTSGKPEQGSITLDATIESDQLLIKIKDDGKGLNIKKLKDKAIEQGIYKTEAEITEEKTAALVFKSGLSTAEKVTSVSGRGVGMDAVKRFLQSKGGDINLTFSGEPSKDGEYQNFMLEISLPADLAVQV